MANNHFIHEFDKGVEVMVPTNVGILHHYRGPCEEVKLDYENLNGQRSQFVDASINCTKQPHTLDRSAHRYKDALTKNMKRVFLEMWDQCKLKF